MANGRRYDDAVYTQLDLYRSAGAGRCGLCGQQRKMSEAHVPPAAIGNRGPGRERAQWVTINGRSRLSNWKTGGLSVYGLCIDCNGVTSARDDVAYIDAHERISRLRAPLIGRLLPSRVELPTRIAPRLVARSLIAGMCAINDRIRELFPEFVHNLHADSVHLQFPPGLQLRLALTDGPRARLGGPVGYMHVLSPRMVHIPLAEVWYPPLAWCLQSTRSTDPR